MADQATPQSTTTTNYYLVICNIQKRTNVRSLLCTAAALGCTGVFVVGQKSFDSSLEGKDIPTPIKDWLGRGEMPLERFAKWNEFVAYVKSNQIRLIGVEIHPDAQPVDAYFQTGATTAFLMGNEGQGLSQAQQADCDGFVRIPQYGNGTASLNVNVAASIILQRIYDWKCGVGAVEE